MGALLTELQGEDDCPARQQLNRWVMEISSMFAATALSNPNGLKQYHLSKMDEGRICRDDELDHALFTGVLVRRTFFPHLYTALMLSMHKKLANDSASSRLTLQTSSHLVQ